jgi:two-component system, sensor histidine kinase
MTLNRHIINKIVLSLSGIAAIACLIIFIVFAFLPWKLFSAFFFFYSAIYGAIYFFSKLGFSSFSSIALFLAIDLGILGLASMVGTEGKFEVMFILLMASPFLLFERKQIKLRMFTATIPFFSFATLLATNYSILPQQSLPENIILVVSMLLNASAFLTAGILFYYFSINRDERLKLGQEMNIQVRKNERLDKAKKVSDRLSEEKSRFIMTISHEFRTPVTGIIGNLELVKEEDIGIQNLPFWHDLSNSAYALNDILEDVLDFSQLEQEDTELHNKICHISEFMNTKCDKFRKLCSDTNLSINVSIDNNVPEKMLFDTHKVQRILNHLISNAIKFTNGPRGEISIRVDINRLGHLQILVHDTGIGIDADKVHTIFNSFTQIDCDLNRNYGGNGLGLYLSWHLANALNGELKVSSEINIGSNFILTLPFTDLSDEITPLNSPSDTQDLSKLDALIVEDNRINQKVLKGMLQNLGMSSEIAINGEEALAVLAQKKFDIIFMDLQMPVMDGLQASRNFREFEQHQQEKHPTPILTISANATPQDMLAAKSAGMNGFLAKPFKLMQLSEKIQEVTSS